MDYFRSCLTWLIVPPQYIARPCSSCLIADSLLHPQYCPSCPSQYRHILSGTQSPVHGSAILSSKLPNHFTRTPIGPGRFSYVVPRPGMHRTCTASTWITLQKLGYTDCYHILNTLANPPDADMWLDAMNAKYHGKGKPL